MQLKEMLVNKGYSSKQVSALLALEDYMRRHKGKFVMSRVATNAGCSREWLYKAIRRAINDGVIVQSGMNLIFQKYYG